MNVKRFVGRNSREAMTRVRAAFGDDAVVLSNRACDEGVEILALPGSAIDSIAQAGTVQAQARAQAAEPAAAPEPAERSERPARQARQRLADDRLGAERSAERGGTERRAAERPMSTVSFEDYVRDRLARRQPEAQPQWAEDEIPVLNERLAAFEPEQRAAAPVIDEPVAAAPIAPRPALAAPPAADAGAERLRAELMEEMKALRGFIGEQVSNIAWLDGVRRNPQHGRTLRRLLDNGFSAAVSRKLTSQMPAELDEIQARQWLQHVIARNLRSDADGELLDRGGVFAIVGPTGVGKTTTTAKIAAQFALRHGTQSIGLITVDHYRVGAHDQLRAFGRILGVPVHTAHDAATLDDFLQIFANKKLVLIDTVGVGQRDERVQELLASLSSPAIRKLVVLNAAAQAATIEDVVAAYQAAHAAGVVISKVDEAVTLGGVVDCAMRHRLRVVGVADGQRVPEDWHAMSADELARRALADRPRSVFSLEDAELPAMWTLPAAMEPIHA